MNLLDIDLNGVFGLTVSPLQLMLRGTLMYWFLFAIFRFVLRRDVGSVGVSDFLFVVILGDAAQNAMIGSATSASDGMVLITTLVFWNYMLDFLSFRIPAIQRFTSPRRLCLVRDGKRLRRNMRRELITDEELNAKIREEGVDDIAAIKRMYLEADGEMSVVKREGAR
ncbi:MAG: YetF domain-containing protein [Caldimonas sp.]